MKQPFGIRRWGCAALGGLGAAVAVVPPAFADNLAILVYPVYIWPVGVLLVLVQLILIIWSWRAKRPARRLGLATIITSAVAGLFYLPFVFWLGISKYWDLNLMTVSPVALLAVVGVIMGRRARRS